MRGNGISRRRLVGLGAILIVAIATPAAARPKHHAAPRHRRRHRFPVIALDAGHGGSDPGAIGPGGIYEKDIVYAVTRELTWLLARDHHYRVVLTRRGDHYVGLRERVARARHAHADLLVSIHANDLPDAGTRGLSVFTLSAKASDRAAAALADAENGADRIGGVDLTRRSQEVGEVLIALAQRQTANASLALAHDIVKVMGHEVPLLDRPRRSAGFVVLTAPDIPSVLVELGCLSNRKEAKLLHKPSYQRKLARGLFRAIEAYFRDHPVR